MATARSAVNVSRALYGPVYWSAKPIDLFICSRFTAAAPTSRDCHSFSLISLCSFCISSHMHQGSPKKKCIFCLFFVDPFFSNSWSITSLQIGPRIVRGEKRQVANRNCLRNGQLTVPITRALCSLRFVYTFPMPFVNQFNHTKRKNSICQNLR